MGFLPPVGENAVHSHARLLGGGGGCTYSTTTATQIPYMDFGIDQHVAGASFANSSLPQNVSRGYSPGGFDWGWDT